MAGKMGAGLRLHPEYWHFAAQTSRVFQNISTIPGRAEKNRFGAKSSKKTTLAFHKRNVSVEGLAREFQQQFQTVEGENGELKRQNAILQYQLGLYK